MPFLKCHLYKEPRSRVLEKLALRNGWRKTIKSPHGSKYTGEWKSSKKQGYGRYISRSDRLFDGHWTKEYRVDDGVLCYGVGNGLYEIEYNGHWVLGHFSGKGVRHFKDNSIYKGNFKNSLRHGYGQMWYQDGSFHDGTWIKDKRNGSGLFVETNGNRYEGYWLEDMKHGHGRYFHLKTGQYQDGVWKNDICVSSIMADIPFRQSSNSPTKYTINEVELEDEANQCTDIIETALLYLDVKGDRFDIQDVKSFSYSTSVSVRPLGLPSGQLN